MNMNTMQPRRRARDTRAAARTSLKPHYWLAVLACLIAAMLGVTVAADFSLNIEISFDDTETTITTLEDFAHQYGSWEYFRQSLQEAWDSIPWELLAIFSSISFVTTVAYTWVGYCVRLGLCRFHLSLTDSEHPTVGMLFSYFGRAFWRSVGMNILRKLILFLYRLPALIVLCMGFYVFGRGLLDLWGIPELTPEVGIYIITLIGQFFVLVTIALLLLFLTLPFALRYVMADFVLAENPEVGAVGALRESRRMMKGNKWRWFCLMCSFIGWHILAAVALGLGGIFLAPYIEQAKTAFYHEVSGRAAIREAVNELDSLMQDL